MTLQYTTPETINNDVYLSYLNLPGDPVEPKLVPHIIVQNGRITLKGVVDNEADKNEKKRLVIPANPEVLKLAKKMNKDLFDSKHFGKAFSDSKDSLPHDVTVSRTVIRLRGSTGPLVPEDVSNALTIKWRQVNSKPAAAGFSTTTLTSSCSPSEKGSGMSLRTLYPDRPGSRATSRARMSTRPTW